MTYGGNGAVYKRTYATHNMASFTYILYRINSRSLS